MGCLVEWIVDLDLPFHHNLPVKTQVSQLKKKCRIIISMCMKHNYIIALPLLSARSFLPPRSIQISFSLRRSSEVWEKYYPPTKWNVDGSVKTIPMEKPWCSFPLPSFLYRVWDMLAKAVHDNSAVDLHSLWLHTCSITNLNGCILEENIPCRNNLTLCIFKS